MKKSGIIITFALLIMAIIALSVTMIRAWLTDTKTTDNVDMVVGDVDYTFTGSLLASNSIIVPGQNVVATAFTLTNESNIGTEIRFSLTVMDGATDITDKIITNIDTDKWVYSSGHYYFRDTNVAPLQDDKYIIPAKVDGQASLVLNILSEIKLDGSKIGNTYSDKTLTFNITFHAKQADYVTWTELGSINWSTGLNA